MLAYSAIGKYQEQLQRKGSGRNEETLFDHFSLMPVSWWIKL